MGDVHVEQAVTIHVRHINAHPRFIASIFACGQPGNQGDIPESSVVIVQK